jgi:hypothetical protein
VSIGQRVFVEIDALSAKVDGRVSEIIPRLQQWNLSLQKTNRLRLGGIGELSWKPHYSFLVRATLQSCRLHPRRAVHAKRGDVQPVLFDRQYGPAPPVGAGE